MNRYNAHWFVEQHDDIEKEAEMWRCPNKRIIVDFHDGSEECWWREAVLSSYCWRIIDRIDNHEISRDYLIRAHVNRKSMENMFNRILSTSSDVVELDYDVIAEEIILAYNRAYNAVRRHLTKYIQAPDAKEIREIVHHPVMEEVYQNMKASHANQRQSYATCSDFIHNHPDMKMNGFARAVREKTVDERQFLTTIVGRYYINDIDNHQFRQPALSGYARGLDNILWSAQESRDASIAELQSKEPVQKSDYLNRRLQGIAAIIRNRVDDDCGTTETIPWYVTKRDLKPLRGMNYQDGDEVRKVGDNDEFLVGKTIQIYAAPTCNHLHKGAVCKKCMGTISAQIPKHFALGHLSVMGALAEFIQLSLSAKHLIVSKEAITFVLDEDTAAFFKFPKQDDTNTLVLKPNVKYNDGLVEFIFRTEDLKFMGDLANGIRSEDIQLSTATFIEQCMISIQLKNKDTIRKTMTVSDMGRKSHFSRDFLSYVIDNPDMLTLNRGVVKVNMEKWNRRLPVFNIPLKITGVKDFMKSFERTILSGSVRYGIDASTPTGIADMMRMCYNIVRECVHISVPHLAVMIASLLIRDKQALDYRLPLPGGKREFSPLGNIYAYRSISQMMAYERRLMYLTSPSLTLAPVRPNHPFDALYFPEKMDIYSDVVDAYHRGIISKDMLPKAIRNKA